MEKDNYKEKLLKGADVFGKLANMYEEMANLYDAEETKENEDKMTMLVGKIMLTMSELQELGL